MEIKETILGSLIFPGISIVGLSLFIGGGLYINHVRNYENRLREKVNVRADINNDNIISRDEMVDVYRNLGLKFNEMSPRKLGNSEMERYLQSYNLEE